MTSDITESEGLKPLSEGQPSKDITPPNTNTPDEPQPQTQGNSDAPLPDAKPESVIPHQTFPPDLPISDSPQHPLSVTGGATMPQQSPNFGQHIPDNNPYQGQPQGQQPVPPIYGPNPFYQQFHPEQGPQNTQPPNQFGQQGNIGQQPPYYGPPQNPQYNNQQTGQNPNQQYNPQAGPPQGPPYGQPNQQQPFQQQPYPQPFQQQHGYSEQQNPFGHIVAPPNYTGPVGSQYYNKPKTWLVEAILVALLCCQPLGIAAIVNAAKVSARYSAGDFQGAKLASDAAKRWIIWGVILAIIIGIGIVALQFITMFGLFNRDADFR